MKTPRELILQNHRPAEAELQKISAAELAAMARANSPRTIPAMGSTAGLLQTVWGEMIAPWRRVWIGLVAAWVVILISNAAFEENSTTVALADTSPPSAETLQVLNEQRRILAQLIEPVEMQPKPDAPRKPGPRSDATIRNAMV